MDLVHPSPGIAANVGRIIPRAVEHHRPAHELRPGIVRVLVVVEKISHREPADVDRVAVHGTLARELILVAVGRLFFVAESEVMRKIQPRDVRLRLGGSNARKLAVRRVCQTVDAAEPPAPGDFRVEIKERVLLQPESEEQCRGKRHIALGVVLETIGTRVRRRKRAVILTDRRRLVKDIPAFWTRRRRGLVGLGAGLREGANATAQHQPSEP